MKKNIGFLILGFLLSVSLGFVVLDAGWFCAFMVALVSGLSGLLLYCFTPKHD